MGLCVYCKGNHHYTSCHLFLRAIKAASTIKVSENYAGEAPAPFIGHYGYPKVNIGILSVPETKKTRVYDDPCTWGKQRYTIPHVMQFRKSLVNAHMKGGVHERSRHLDQVQEIALSKNPVSIEIVLKKKLISKINFNHTSAPFGPRAKLVKSSITSTPKIHTKVDKVFSDSDRKASSALKYLYSSGFNENTLNRMLSVGVFGVKLQRRLIPTRWSITATDDILGKQVLEEVKTFSFHECKVFSGAYIGNYYYVLLFPGVWSYELFELYEPIMKTGKSQFSTDYESYDGRKTYAEHCAGGYYTVRLAIVEYLKQQKRQARVLVLRVITKEYTTPLGVWVTREATRHAMKNTPLSFSSETLALHYSSLTIQKKFGFSIEKLLKKSRIVSLVQQRSLDSWT